MTPDQQGQVRRARSAAHQGRPDLQLVPQRRPLRWTGRAEILGLILGAFAFIIPAVWVYRRWLGVPT